MSNESIINNIRNLRFGLTIDRNISKAIILCENAIEQKNTDAMIELANIYLEDIDVNTDRSRIIELYREAGIKKNVTAIIKLIDLDLNSAELDNLICSNILQILIDAANKKNTCAITKLAFMHKHGILVERNREKAYELYEEAVKILDRDTTKNTNSMVNFGSLKYNGIGCEKNIDDALSLFTKAFENGNAEILIKIAKIHYDREFYQEYESCLKKAISMGMHYAAFSLANFYYNGPEKYRNIEKASRIYQLCIKKKDHHSLAKFASFCKSAQKTNLFLKKYIEYYDYLTFDINEGIDLKLITIDWIPILHKWWPFENRDIINEQIITLLLISKFRKRNKSINNVMIKGTTMIIIKKLCNMSNKIKPSK